MTFDEAKAALLQKLDKQYAEMRAIAEDDRHTNKDSGPHSIVQKKFAATLADIFDLKNVRDTAERLAKGKQ